MTDNSTMDDLSPDALIRLPYGVVANEPAITLNGNIEYDRVLNIHKLGTDGKWCVYRETVFDTDDFETVYCELDSIIKGDRNVFFVCAGDFEFDEWQFAK